MSELAVLVDYIESRKKLSLEEFIKRYPEPVLIPLGYLSTAEIKASKESSTALLLLSFKPSHEYGKTHPLAGKVIKLIPRKEKDKFYIGRSDGNDLVIPDPTVSSIHAVIGFLGNQAVVVDLGSKNGTFVNLIQLNPDQFVPLEDEDIISFGRYSFQFFTSKGFYFTLGLLVV